MSKVSRYGCVYDRVYRKTHLTNGKSSENGVHGIRDKIGWNHTQADIRNKRTLYCFVKSQEEANAKGCGRNTGGRLSRSSDEASVMDVKRRAKHVKLNNN